jgi:hypothetical protein
MTLAELRAQLSAVEPDDSTYYGIGIAELPLLEQLLQDAEPWLAARVVFLLRAVFPTRARRPSRSNRCRPPTPPRGCGS